MRSPVPPKSCTSPITSPQPYPFGWFDWFCLWYPPAWLILFNRHWQHYKPDPEGWRWSEYLLFLIPAGFYLAIAIRWVRIQWQRAISPAPPEAPPTPPSPEADRQYQHAFRQEILTPIVQHYFRATLENPASLPASHPLLITINHAGMCFPWDFLCLTWLLGEQRSWRMHPLAHPLFFDHPWLQWWLPSGWAAALGAIRAEPQAFAQAIAQHQTVIYAPEGWRGLAKGWPQRYQLAPFDPSFIRHSVTHHIPILPILCLGSERLHPFAINARAIAQRVGMPMFPLSPLLPLFALFPSMGIWAARKRLRYQIQPLWQPWADHNPHPPTRKQTYQMAQALRSRLQTTLNELITSTHGDG